MMSTITYSLGMKYNKTPARLAQTLSTSMSGGTGRGEEVGRERGGREMAKRKGKGRGKDSFVRPVLCMLLH